MKQGKGLRALIIASVAALIGCGDPKVAGGSDDVENPALTIALRDSTGSGIQGEVQIYARLQNPTLDSLPVLKVQAVQGLVTIHDTVLFAAMAEAKARGMAWPNVDTVAFNWVAQNPQAQGEAFVDGFVLVRLDAEHHRFAAGSSGGNGLTIIGANAKGGLEVAAVLPEARSGVAGNVGQAGQAAEGLGLSKVFVAGSPYVAAIGPDGHFAFARMAKGSYALKAQAEDGKVYEAPNLLNTDAALPYIAEDWTEADLIWVAP
jgi:hypothetical protein